MEEGLDFADESKEEKAETVTSPVIGATSVPITIELDLGTRKGNIVKVYIEKLVIAKFFDVLYGNQKLLKPYFCVVLI